MALESDHDQELEVYCKQQDFSLLWLQLLMTVMSVSMDATK